MRRQEVENLRRLIRISLCIHSVVLCCAAGWCHFPASCVCVCVQVHTCVLTCVSPAVQRLL